MLVRPRIVLLIAALILSGGFITRSQENQPPPKVIFSVNVDVVNVFVSVRNKKGNIVRDLTQEDFTLREDGREQSIQYFSRETDVPLTIGLIVDTTPSESNMLEEQKRTTRVFLNKMLRPSQDYAFLIQFGNEVELLGGLTNSRERLEKALDLLERHQLETRGQTSGFDINTILSDAIYLASDKIMKAQQGRKALIIMADGFHLGNREEMAIAAAQQADILIYTIRIFDKAFSSNLATGPFGWSGGWAFDNEWRENLKTLSRRTGGSSFEVDKNETLDQIYGKIEEELRNQYSLGYTPDSKARNGYRKIKIGVRKKDMIVRGREGYYPRLRK
jgi:VWFA-related protein